MSIMRLVKWLLFALLLLVAWLARAALKRAACAVGAKWAALSVWLREREALDRYVRSSMTPFVLLGLIVIALVLGISIRIVLILLVLLWVSTIDHIIRARKRKAAGKGRSENLCPPLP